MSESKALSIVPKSLPEVQSLSEILSKSHLLPDALKQKPADIMVSILTGQELGLPPMAAIRGVHVVQGKPLIAADTMVALVLSSGLCEYFVCVEESDTTVTYETKRKGAPIPQRSTWTADDSKRADLHKKDNYRLHPRQMMKARCKSILARDVYPDVLAGCYDPDEIAAPVVGSASTVSIAPSAAPKMKHADAIDAEVVSETPVEHPAFAQIDAAPTVEALKALGSKGGVLASLKGAVREEAKRRYDARMVKLEAKPELAVACDGEHGEPACADPNCWNGNDPAEAAAS